MAIPNPLVITYNAASKSLPRINQDGYGSEYFLKEATQEFRVKIRHSSESPQKDGTRFERHNVELTRTVYAVAPATVDYVEQVYSVIRNRKTATAADVSLLGTALSTWLDSAHHQDLVAWVN